MQVDFTEDELLALAVIKPGPRDLKKQYQVAHERARQKCADAYITARTTPDIELSPVEEPSTLGLARRVAVARADITTLVKENLGNGRLLRIDYRSLDGVLTTNRLIEPKFVDTSTINGNSYLRAYDFGRESRRTFRVDRIERAELVEDGI